MEFRAGYGKTGGTKPHNPGAPITHLFAISPCQGQAAPRAKGAVSLGAKALGQRTVLDDLRQSGSFKCLFPRPARAGLEAVLLNTAGGVTGGNSFRFTGKAARGTTMTLTTQTCERVYRAAGGHHGQVANHLTVAAGARVNWLPQETILFNGSALERRLLVEMAADASLLLIESMIFGRAAMGETLTDIRLHDRIEIRIAGTPVFLDALRFAGDFQAHLSRAAIANGAGAMALILFASATAEGQLGALRGMLPDSAGTSLIRDNLLAIRILASDGFALRRSVMPVLRRLNDDTLPRCWML